MTEPETTALRASDVAKSYPLGETSLDVLRGVSLEVAAGEVCAVMGPSGVGKSTLLACIAGIDSPDRGSIAVAGKPMTGLDDDARTLLRRRHIGIVYQFFNLVANLTARENVMLPYLIDGASPDDKAIDDALARVGMSARASHYPTQLSGGEMQLVSIARAIVRRPGLVLADEPTGNVNVATGRKILGLLREVVKDHGSALLLVTHNPEDASRADRIVFMTDGTIDPSSALAGDEVSLVAIHERLRSLGI